MSDAIPFIALVAGLYLSVSMSLFIQGAITYSVYRDGQSSNAPAETRDALRQIRWCFLWPVIYTRPAMKFAKELARDLKESK